MLKVVRLDSEIAQAFLKLLTKAFPRYSLWSLDRQSLLSLYSGGILFCFAFPPTPFPNDLDRCFPSKSG